MFFQPNKQRSEYVLRFSAAARACRWLLLSSGLLFLTAQAEVLKEYQVKAAFLYNFTKFVEWPPASFADKSSPIVIGVLGQNPFGDELAGIVANRKANGRSVVVRELSSLQEAGSVHVVFVSSTEDHKLSDALIALHHAGVLTVGESPRFAKAGGMINFTMESDKVRFEINQGASEGSGLKISAQLLKLATVVHRK